MATITKKELIDRIADNSNQKRVQVKKVVQLFLDEIVSELGKGNRLEFRDFGVFETKLRKARRAQNPKTPEPVAVPEKRTLKFKVGRLMKQKLGDLTGSAIDDEDNQLGVRGIGAPVRDAAGRVIASVSVSGPAERMPDARLTGLAPLVIQTADDISDALS